MNKKLLEKIVDDAILEQTNKIARIQAEIRKRVVSGSFSFGDDLVELEAAKQVDLALSDLKFELEDKGVL